MSDENPVFLFDSDDPAIREANQKARKTFRYFWRELAWENRRIVPALSIACVKAAFSDKKPPKRGDDPQVEHMWLNEIDFDGTQIHGVLLNSPNWLKDYDAGDDVHLPVDRISDWMITLGDDVYGAFTVQLMRSRMSKKERRDHDNAWGIDFGDPDDLKVIPSQELTPEQTELVLQGFGKDVDEHPMSFHMADHVRKHFKENPDDIDEADEYGWTLLHQQALAGSLPVVEALLKLGADKDLTTDKGLTPLDLARSLKWGKVMGLLKT
jgi:uncharacterized protein